MEAGNNLTPAVVGQNGNVGTSLYLIEMNAEALWLMSCFFAGMSSGSRSERIKWVGLDVGSLVGTVVATIALVTGFCAIAADRGTNVPSPRALIPAQLSMGRPGLTSVPSARRMAKPAKSEAGLTPEQQSRLAEVMNRMTPKERKRLAKAVKHMTPEKHRQFVAALKQQLAKKRTAR